MNSQRQHNNYSLPLVQTEKDNKYSQLHQLQQIPILEQQQQREQLVVPNQYILQDTLNQISQQLGQRSALNLRVILGKLRFVLIELSPTILEQNKDNGQLIQISGLLEQLAQISAPNKKQFTHISEDLAKISRQIGQNQNKKEDLEKELNLSAEMLLNIAKEKNLLEENLLTSELVNEPHKKSITHTMIKDPNFLLHTVLVAGVVWFCINFFQNLSQHLSNNHKLLQDNLNQIIKVTENLKPITPPTPKSSEKNKDDIEEQVKVEMASNIASSHSLPLEENEKDIEGQVEIASNPSSFSNLQTKKK